MSNATMRAVQNSLTVEVVLGNVEYSASGELRNAMLELLQAVGEKGGFTVRLLPVAQAFLKSDHSFGGFRWKGPTMLGIQGSFYAAGFKEERVRFYLIASGKARDHRYNQELFKKILAKTAAEEQEDEDEEEEEKREEKPVSPPPAILEITKDVLETCLLMLFDVATDGHIASTSDVLTVLRRFCSDTLVVDRSQDILRLLLKEQMIVAKGEGYDVTDLKKAEPAAQAEPAPVVSTNVSVAIPAAPVPALLENLPKGALEKIARLCEATQRFELRSNELADKRRELQSQVGRRGEVLQAFDREQKLAMEAFVAEQRKARAELHQREVAKDKPIKDRIAELEKEVGPGSPLAKAKEAYDSFLAS
ncbi:MAG: hypothetical protein PHV93_00065 [Candidatus Pacebacteria bacterium]|nr:hypothetical protein [Candidatus Paceibacterota bacterium]